jgi:hypothetical protein
MFVMPSRMSAYRNPGERAAVPREHRRWFTKMSSGEKGPFDAQALRESLKAGYIKRGTLVRAEDETDWQPLGDVQDIVRGVAPSPSGIAKPGFAVSDPLTPDGTNVLIYGALACTITFFGLLFGIAGIVAARAQNPPGKYTRAGYILSIVGVVIQLLVVAAIILVMTIGKTH